ncbi:hypothetical protein [Kitasatospora cathayae]|uniref:Uncharacterized protein n=1 Tax=Kitasatospora cathayae TaxID=3004092 RepID=A0ABY7QAA0_9ACTN|nr:hypothetical protein [Kitasatospora sp. HUAS 3-15]WBP89557.1 hypothetical protein O1G21_29410 [Kitasatospora sp. HUAS 3-15]
MSSRKPGWSLERPFDLAEAARDIIAAAQILAAHGRHPTGSSEQAAEIQQATAAIHAINRRVEQHSARRR